MQATEAAAPREVSRGAGSLLVVDDEPVVLELLPTALRHAGFTVTTAATGRQAVAAAYENPPDLVVLDVMLPDMDGFTVIRRLRDLPDRTTGETGRRMPVLFLTALDTTEDMLNGLRLGGDDYVTKPFDLQVLIARIHAVLRRTTAITSPLMSVADVQLDPDAHQVTRAGQPVRLSPTEFRLLHFLILNAGRVVSKAQILDNVWHYDFDGDPSIVDTYVSYLRRKLDAGRPRLIHTIYGQGYVLRRPTP
ncbi:response regulator transcription factor [Streptomyces sp. CA-210063]|uniref:response regulator transcription factor n=1 Tax=Streptomyces sp. CA-210063 TaxID=2801029 RepID=UPI00214C422E|nr:response regulator transcription factor [Streptomyces sp. CA-210063]UUU29478.1 response regulator transcription factor [Streptomyces sp. CA-210063]